MSNETVETMQVQFAYENDQYREPKSLEQQLGEHWKKRIFEIVLTNVCASVESQGLRSTQSRSYNRVLAALDATKSSMIQLSRADAEFLKHVLLHEQARVAPLQARIFCLMQDAVEQAFR